MFFSSSNLLELMFQCRFSPTHDLKNVVSITLPALPRLQDVLKNLQPSTES